MDNNLRALHKASSHNHDAVKAFTSCGCFYCLAVVDSFDVEFGGRAISGATAFCPHCGIDAVLPGVTDKGLLRAMHAAWFK